MVTISKGRAFLHRIADVAEDPLFELGELESRFLREKLKGVVIDRPLYVMGLARSGTTVTLEIIQSQTGVVSHRYEDFPLLPIIYHWRRFLHKFSKASPAVERSHADGLYVTSQSPEAFEEMLWMHFFPKIHDAGVNPILDSTTDNPLFENFYKDHIRKLLLVEHAKRYVAKGNYNITRMHYIAKLFPDAKFVVPVRHPVAHIASLMRQHDRFCELQHRDPALRDYMKQAGHFEFGLGRRFINVGDIPVVDDDVASWAHYWNAIHSYLLDELQASPQISASTLILSYEALCESPHTQIAALLAHCEVDADKAEMWEDKLKLPDYYKPEFSEKDLETIRNITGKTAQKLGYSL